MHLINLRATHVTVNLRLSIEGFKTLMVEETAVVQQLGKTSQEILVVLGYTRV